MSQVQLSVESGLGKSQISKYENGKELPKLESLRKMLATLKVTPQAFFYVVATYDEQATKIEEPNPTGGTDEVVLALLKIVGRLDDLTQVVRNWLEPEKH